MQHTDLLDIVQPAKGWFAVVGIKGTGADLKRQQHLVETRTEVDDLAARLVRNKWNVFFGVAKYATGANRTKDNVQGLKAFWLDIDCGASKAIPNPKTKRPDGYIDQATGLQALRQFCKTVGLPKPLLVNSGRGIHAYWPLTTEVTRAEWEPVAARLRDLCNTHSFFVDPVVFEVARIMRIPGTLNFKDDPANPVTVLSSAPAVDFAAFRDVLGVKPAKAMEIPQRRESNLGKKLIDDSSSRFSKIMRRSAKGDGCQQLLACYKERSTLSEIRWFDALSVAKFCVDRDSAIQKISSGHPDYDPASALDKTKHISGPHNCSTFERNNPGGCYGCPYFGKIKNPIVLGKEIAGADVEDGEYKVTISGADKDLPDDVRIPEFPFPFMRGKTGGIYLKPDKEEELPTLVYEHDLYVVKMMTDPKDGDVAVMRLHLPREGIREFVVPQKQAVGDPAELRKILASKGVACTQKQFTALGTFVTLAIKKIQYDRKAELMRMQFGWADNDSKFIIGDREVTSDGVFHSPPSSITSALAERMVPSGTYEKWKEVFSLYGREGLEPHAFAALTAFGAPLFKFTGQSGAILNVIHPKSGTGKTTILHMCNSVWGHPRDLCAVKEDTANAKTMHLGLMNNLPFCVDEMTNMAPDKFSEMAYNMSQGRGKNRMKASGNELRLNTTTWQTISLCSSNASFYEKMNLIKQNPDGEMMRLLEYKIGYSDAIPTDFAKRMFDHQLLENYGHAGPIFIEWVLNNLEEVKNTLKVVQAKIDRELKLTQRERFWSAEVASNITGGMIARRLKIIDWDLKRIYEWATSMILETRNDVAAPVETYVSVLGDYINRHINNVLVVNELADKRTNMAVEPVLEPRGELYVRFEPDTKRLFIDAKHFRKDCIQMQVNFKELKGDLKRRGIFIKADSKRMTKGMAITSTSTYAMEFDTTVGGFFDVAEMLPLDNEGASAGGRD